MDAKIGIVSDEDLLKEMFLLRNHIKITIGKFITNNEERLKIDDLSIGSVLLELGCEIYDVCNIPKSEFMRIIEGQFDITRERLAQQQAEGSEKQ